MAPFLRTLLIAWVMAVQSTASAAAALDADQPPPGEAAPAAQPAGGMTYDAQPAPAPEGRELNGHLFLPSAEVPSPFAITSLVSYLTLGIGSTTAPVQFRIRTIERTVTYAGVGGVLGFEGAFLRYFSARLLIDEVIYSGLSGSSVLAVGSTLAVGFTPGLTASLPVGDKARVAFLFDARYAPSMALTIGSGISSIVDSCSLGQGCDVDRGSVFSQQNVWTVQPALAGSWAPMSPLGLTANVAFQNASSGDFSGQAIRLALAADFDFAHVSTVPVGLLAQFSWLAPVGGSGLQHVTDVGGGIFYTGRRNLAAGVQLVLRRFAVTPNVAVSFSTALSSLGLRYYW